MGDVAPNSHQGDEIQALARATSDLVDLLDEARLVD